MKKVFCNTFFTSILSMFLLKMSLQKSLSSIPFVKQNRNQKSQYFTFAVVGNGDDVPSFALLPWRHLRLHGAQQSEAVAELHFAVTTEKVEKAQHGPVGLGWGSVCALR